MAELTLEALLKANPRAAREGDSIKEVLEALREIRAAGLGGDGYNLASPYGGGYAVPKHSRSEKRLHGRQTDT